MIKGKLQAYRVFLKEAYEHGDADKIAQLEHLISEWQKELDKLDNQ